MKEFAVPSAELERYRTLSREALLEEVERLYGEILVSRRAAELTAQLVSEQFARLEAVTHELETANRNLERLSTIDGLTEIPNRAHFDATFDSEWRRCRRHGLPLTLAMIDIDHFKDYNDHYGHAAGDDCLKQVARALQWTIRRAADFVARYGGEEFVYILPAADLEVGLAIAEEARASIEQMALPHAASPIADTVTISVGLATATPGDAAGPGALLKQADRQLYRAKELGRNRLCAAGHP